jgi:hypothetical protein
LYVVQSTGDGIFALFGAPVAHEDRPQRALYAALRMQEELRRYSAKVVADGSSPIQGRVGINTGEVVVRSITTGAGQVEYTPIGHTTNLASRMQTAAPVGSIAVSENTRKLCEGYFILKPLGATKVKGVSEPVNVYEVTGLGPLRMRLQRSAGRGLTKFVGREREMEALKHAANQAKAGHGQIVATMEEAANRQVAALFRVQGQESVRLDGAGVVSLDFATVHTPVQQPPQSLLPITEPDTGNLDCSGTIDQRVLTNQMEEALDMEVGRLLVSIGLATRGQGGQLVYHPKQTNTVVVFVTDNGSLGSVVKLPFDGTRSKSTVYQTGVWNPAIVAGPQVNQPGRQVNAMVNIVDLYQLFGQLAGIDVHKSVPRTVDSASMLPYLVNPGHASIRKSNFTELGTNLHAGGEINGPCQYNTTTCTQIAPTQSVCEDNSGIWWGVGATDPSTAGAGGLKLCCDVAVWQANHSETISTDIYPLEAFAVRNNRYKLVINDYQAYDATSNSCVATSTKEFYQINENVPLPKLDTANADLLANGAKLNPAQQKNYDSLNAQCKTLLASQPACPGDINLDGSVDYLDIADWEMFQTLSAGLTNWVDIDLDGMTNDVDLSIILQNQGACPG